MFYMYSCNVSMLKVDITILAAVHMSLDIRAKGFWQDFYGGTSQYSVVKAYGRVN